MQQLKRTAKALALEAAKAGGGLVAGGTLPSLQIAFRPPRSPVPYPGGARAAACVSIDFDANSPERKAANSVGTYALVDLSERHGVPLTWAICGKDAEADRAAYSRLLDSSVEPEVGVHTYSHIDVSASSAELLEEEIERCVGVLGLTRPPVTFVFPWNREGHFEVLARMGFKAYRGKERVVGGLAPREGVWNIPPTYYVGPSAMGASALITRYANVCMRYGAVFHLWLHPWSIVQGGSAAGAVKTTLEPVFEHMARMRDEGSLATTTMGAVAEALEGVSGAK